MKLILQNWRKYLIEQYDENVAQTWVMWVKSLPTKTENVERPVTFKRRQEKGTICCWCGLKLFVGVEHIIPRSAGAPATDTWNLAWACYPCNHQRQSDIGLLSREWLRNYRNMLGADPEPTGWLYEEFKAAPEEPTKQELLEYFKQDI